ncbi:hypothetical protein E8E13_005362 [Curvularia kusanoi]|uniref:Uncharacterized protein n=1 Tax=Curvularia kusanoi TaxID=90978 RepID=A0A9P4W701_CURKU|nr:hypothetical protein E8E13_005362 [Curvularia kusanoi]
MQITSILAALLLASPAIVTAAPVTSDNSISVANDVFARYENTCNPQFSTDPKKRAEQKAAEQRMKDLTKEYKAAEARCPKNALADFDKKSTNKQFKEKWKKNCTEGYTECAAKREAANKACVASGGKTDPGHANAVKFCKAQAAIWRKKVVK